MRNLSAPLEDRDFCDLRIAYMAMVGPLDVESNGKAEVDQIESRSDDERRQSRESGTGWTYKGPS